MYRKNNCLEINIKLSKYILQIYTAYQIVRTMQTFFID
jgi:hypothetical protein